MPLQAILFDWSGTLSHDLDVVLKTQNEQFIAIGALPRALEEQDKFYAERGQRQMVGAQEITKQFYQSEMELPYMKWYSRFTDCPKERIDKIFFEIYTRNAHETSIIPGAENVLQYLKINCIKSLVLSASQQPHIEKEIARYNLEGLFDEVKGSCYDKRDDIKELMNKHGLIPYKTIFIGDMVHDVETALHAGIISVAVSHPKSSYTIKEKLLKANPHYIIEDIKSLIPLAELLRQWPISELMPHQTYEERPIMIENETNFKSLAARLRRSVR
ncbi:MAG: HAD hydrolase-like protein [archaeon]